MTTTSAFIEAVEAERARLAWTPQELAQRAGLEKSGLSRLMTGARLPTIRTVVALGTAFGTSEEERTQWIAKLALVADVQRAAARVVSHGRVEDLGLTPKAETAVRAACGDRVRDLLQLPEATAQARLGGAYKEVQRVLRGLSLHFGAVVPEEDAACAG